jgi:hypothetical protein
MDLIALAPWAPWVLFGAAVAVIFVRLRRTRRSGARRDRPAGAHKDGQTGTIRDQQTGVPPRERNRRSGAR